MVTITEREAGKIASKMMENSLLSIIRAQGFSKNKDRDKKNSLAQSKSLFRMQKNNPETLKGIYIKMGKHGFIQNYGVKRERRGGKVHRKKPHSIVYHRKSHPFSLTAKNFLDTAIEKSGAVEYLEKVIGDIKADKVVTKIKYGIENGE